MNIAFKIPPAPQHSADLHLLAEVSPDELSILLFSKSPFSACGFYAYRFDKHITDNEYAGFLHKIVSGEKLLQQPFSSCHICYNGNESVLTPAAYFSDAEKGTMCTLLFGENRSAICFHEPVQGHDLKNVYRVPQKIYDTVNAVFPKSSFSHSTSAQLENKCGNILQCIVYHNHVKLILFSNDLLQIVRYAKYASPADVCYEMLNTCRQFAISTDVLNLSLSGMIDKHSNLYREIYRYFSNVSFANVSVDDGIAQNLREHPDHFYSHLVALAQCV